MSGVEYLGVALVVLALAGLVFDWVWQGFRERAMTKELAALRDQLALAGRRQVDLQSDLDRARAPAVTVRDPQGREVRPRGVKRERDALEVQL